MTDRLQWERARVQGASAGDKTRQGKKLQHLFASYILYSNVQIIFRKMGRLFCISHPVPATRTRVRARAVTLETCAPLLLGAAIAAERHMALVRVLRDARASKRPARPASKKRRDEWMDLHDYKDSE